MSTLVLLAGPNGSGKSSLRQLPGFRTAMRTADNPEVIDPDEIERELSPEAASRAIAAGREALKRRTMAIREGRPILIETTLASKDALRAMRTAADAGYRIDLHYVGLESADDSVQRVADRVATGGHDIPEVDIRHRYERSLQNLPDALAAADNFAIYDNTSSISSHRQVARATEALMHIDVDLPAWADVAIKTSQALRHSPQLEIVCPIVADEGAERTRDPFPDGGHRPGAASPSSTSAVLTSIPTSPPKQEPS